MPNPDLQPIPIPSPGDSVRHQDGREGRVEHVFEVYPFKGDITVGTKEADYWQQGEYERGDA